MKCPKCVDLGLVEHTQEPGTYYCGNCGGHWLEYTPMESYLVEQDEMILYFITNRGLRESAQWTMRGGGKRFDSKQSSHLYSMFMLVL